MDFLQTAFLFALPLALLPVVIHLLNRLRFKTVPWAAMMFLLKADRTSTRREKIRHLLILASRCLALFLFLFALSRPLVGGWLGSRMGAQPDLVLILLDRSASMEALDPRSRKPRREHALQLFAQTAEQLGQARVVLLDSASGEATEIPRPDLLSGLDRTSSSGTAADIPTLLRQAADFLTREPAGNVEIWLASDLQRSNWHLDSPLWGQAVNQLQDLPQDIQLRVLSLAGEGGMDQGILLGDVVRQIQEGKERLQVRLEMVRADEPEGIMPIVQNYQGIRTQFEVEARGNLFQFDRPLEVASEAQGGWGSFSLPADDNVMNNTTFFVHGQRAQRKTLVVGPNTSGRELLRMATVPDGLARYADSVTPEAFELSQLADTALLVWMAGDPGEAVNVAVNEFIHQGGTLLVAPPDDPAVASGVIGVPWGGVETPGDAVGAVETWEESDGPLAKTGNGQSLPLASLEITKRRLPVWEESEASNWAGLALYADGLPLLARKGMGRGNAYVLSTLPDRSWSSLREGPVLVPMMLRLLEEGGRRLDPSRVEVCGMWNPGDITVWERLDDPEGGNPLTQPGVYVHGDQRVAVNIPELELDPAQAAKDEISGVFGSLRVEVLDDLLSRGASESRRSEIWRPFIYGALIFMILESILLLTGRRREALQSRAATGPRKEAAA